MFGRGDARIGFDWSGETVKAVRVVSGGGKPRVTHAHLAEAKSLALAFAGLRAAGIRPGRGRFHASLPSGAARIREFAVDRGGEANLAGAVREGMIREAGPPAGEWALDFREIRRGEEGEPVSVLAAATDLRETAGFRDSLERAGARPDRLEPAAIAGINHWLRMESGEGAWPARALLDIGGAAARLSFVREGSPLRTRRIGLGGADFTREIAERCDIAPEEAERLKRAEAPLASLRPDRAERAAPMADLVRTTMDRLAGEVRAHHAAFRNAAGPVGGLTLAGGGALLLGIDRALSLRLDLPVDVIDPFAPFALPEEWSGGEGDRFAGGAPRFLTALGLSRWWE